MKTKYFYTRDFDGKITATYGMRIDEDTDTVFIARAFVHPKEQAVKRAGRAIVDADIEMMELSNQCSKATVNYEYFGDTLGWASMCFHKSAFSDIEFLLSFANEVFEWVNYSIEAYNAR